MNFSKILKKYLFSLIDEIGKNHALYTRNPNRDFSRIKKWSFSKTLLCTLSIGAGSLNSELLKFFYFDPNMPKVAISQKANRVYGYQVNFTNAIFICRKFFITKEQESPPDVEKFIQRELLPIQLGRSFPRNLKSRPTTNFIYKIY